MNPDILSFLSLLAGITFAIAAINLTIGLQKEGEKTYLFLGLIGVCVGIYYLLFPQITFETPLPLVTRVGFFFFLTNFALLPWFFGYFTGYSKPGIQWTLSLGMALSYLLLNISANFSKPVYWNIIGHVFLMGIILYGFRSCIFLKRQRQKWSSSLLLWSLIVFLILTVDDIIRTHIPSVYPFEVPENILPFDYFLILFMIVMALKLARDIQLKYNLEKSLNVQEKRWGNLLEKIQLLVVSVDRNEKIGYLNPFFLKLTGLSKEKVMGQHFMVLIPEKDRKSLNKFAASIKDPKEIPHYQNTILTKSGNERSISWSAVRIYNEDGNFERTLSIGSDITDKQKAYEEINVLKTKLEEENILLKSELSKTPVEEKIIGKSDAIRYVLRRAKQVAITDSTVLLEGETGVGKELVANYIQQNSTRAKSPFIKLSTLSNIISDNSA